MRIAVAVLVACSPSPSMNPPPGGIDAPPGVDPGIDAPGTTACGEAPTCTAWNVATTCGVSETCSNGCYAGACAAAACSDECALGATGPTGRCRLWDAAAARFVDADPAVSMHDRARDYDRRQRVAHQPEGGVLAVFYTSPALTTVASYDSVVDSALWTGTLLAAHSWRHLVTRSADSAERIAAVAGTLHTWMNLSSSPGYLARFAATEAHATGNKYNLDCARKNVHCGAAFGGQTYRWRGDTSRDQYTGVMLGYLFAYLATPDAALRAAIRDDVLEFVEQLMIVRQDVPVHLTINGFPLDVTLDTKFLILAPEEMTDGRVTIAVDTSDVAGGDLAGAREFVPDAGAVFGQLIGQPNLEIPRPGSAIMLGAFYRMALAMTDGVPELAARRAAILADYNAEFERLASIGARGDGVNECGAKYYGIHISYIMAYLWTSLESDPARRARLANDILGLAWSNVDDHKNPYFAFMNAGLRSGFSPAATAAAQQLAQFTPAPRILAPRDHLADYPHDGNCSQDGRPLSSIATDVRDRVVSDFQWQRHPWLLYSAGDTSAVAPGVDYLAAYWLGRYHDLVADDHAGTCTRWDN